MRKLYHTFLYFQRKYIVKPNVITMLVALVSSEQDLDIDLLK